MRRGLTSGRGIVLALMLALSFSSFITPVYGQRSMMPTAATDAKVKSDVLNVFSEMDTSSEQGQSLKKDDAVYVDLRIDQGGRSWCGVRHSRQSSRLGYVDCKSLERIGTASALNSPDTKNATQPGSRAPVAEIPLARPARPTDRAFDAIKSQVIKEGVIDSGYIASLEAQAKSGEPTALTRAALAHFAAGEFELSQHEMDGAIEHFQAMEPFAGSQRELLLASLLGHAYSLLLKSEFSAALEPIARARKLAPQSAEAAALSGWAHYKLNQPDAAIADLQAAQRLQPSESVARFLEQAKRDKQAEGDFREGESRHFILRYHGGATRQLASEVIATLEEQFKTLQGELRYTPPEPIGVILYTEEVFQDLTRVPSWAGGLNDGRIRIPVQGLEHVSDLLEHILKHELTHSFVFQKTAGRAPTWLQEGVAQWMEGRRTGGDAAPLIVAFQDGKGASLRYFEGPWMRYSAQQARFAYAWSLAAVESIEATSGSDGLGRLLEATRTEASPEAAIHQALRIGYSGLDESTLDYLRQTYPQ